MLTAHSKYVLDSFESQPAANVTIAMNTMARPNTLFNSIRSQYRSGPDSSILRQNMMTALSVMSRIIAQVCSPREHGPPMKTITTTKLGECGRSGINELYRQNKQMPVPHGVV